MKSGIIYIKRRQTGSNGYCTWVIVKHKFYTSAPQRKQLMETFAKRCIVNDVHIVLSVIPRG